MPKTLLYDMSRRLDSGKWEVVGKAYQDSDTGRITMWVDPDKMRAVLKGQKEGVACILFPKDRVATAPVPVEKSKPKASSPIYDQRNVAPPVYTQPPQGKASNAWPPDFDDNIPF